MAYFVTVRQDGKEKTTEYSELVRLSDVIADSGFSFALPCGGKSICGNCKVNVQGCVTAPSDIEKAFLGSKIDNGVRLACLTYANGNVIIDIPKEYTPRVKFGEAKTEIKPISGDKQCFACAVDIGTTTVALRYYTLPDGELIFSDSCANPQNVRGADVLTRIEYASNSGLDELKALIDKAIDDSVCRFGHEIEFFVITGNTAMLHIAAGIDPRGLATAPFEPSSLFGEWIGNRYFMRCASSYIGGDIVASLLASGITDRREKSLLLDIGTNNECILWDGEGLTACSSPAGPAFEGACISCGVSAKQGVIYKVGDENGEVKYSTIGDAEPIGFCGSGLIDAVAFLLKKGYIANDGSVVRELPYFGKMRLEAQDIAELQLAKSAVCAGILTLLHNANLTLNELDRIYLTGSFGERINKRKAGIIGLIPKGACDKTITTECGAIAGASALLLNKELIEKSKQIADSIKTIELADSKFFEKAFLENMWF